MPAVLKYLKQYINRVPIAGPWIGSVYAKILTKRFPGSETYWIGRYKKGGNSGDGSYRFMAEFKAGVINKFVDDRGIKSVIEYGCGDGNQLKLMHFKKYLGFDISPEAVSRCKEGFKEDPSKSFRLLADYHNETADLTLSLDVVYHLIEDEIYEEYLGRLFSSSTRFVIIYSSNKEQQEKIQLPHVKHRNFTPWIARNLPGWKLIEYIPNQYPFQEGTRKGSFADFFIYKKL